MNELSGWDHLAKQHEYLACWSQNLALKAAGRLAKAEATSWLQMRFSGSIEKEPMRSPAVSHKSSDGRWLEHRRTSLIKNLMNRLTLDQSPISIILLCIIMVGAALRFYDLGAESYWLDEVWTVRLRQESLDSVLVLAQDAPSYPPVYLLLAHFWMQVFGTTEAATRSLSALAGIASVAVMYRVGRELFERKVGLLSALLMAISEFQIYYSQDFRFYSLFVLMALCSFLFYIRALRSNRPGHFVPYVLASILLFYTHTYGVFVLVAQNLYFLLQWNRYRRARALWLMCQMLILLALGPGLLHAVKRTVAGTANVMRWIPDRPLWFPLRTVFWYVFPLRHSRSWMTLVLNLVAGMVFFVIGTTLFVIWKGKEQWLASVRGLVSTVQDLSSQSSELFLASLWFLCPIALPFVLSKVFGPMYVDKYTISASPALYLLLALGITTVSKVVPEFISLAVLVILIAPGLHHYYVTDVKEQWREAAAYVDENARKDDVIVFAPAEGGWLRNSFYWYYRGNLPGCDIDIQPKNDDEAIADALAGCISGRERFWLILRGGPERIAHLTAFFLDRDHEDMHLTEEQSFTLISVYLFALTGQ